MIKLFTVLKVSGSIIIIGTWRIPSDTEGLHILVLIGMMSGCGLIATDLAREMFLKPTSEEESD